MPERRDEDAFVAFAQGARGRLRSTAYLLCGDWDRAADHVQEALIRVYVAWPRLTKAGREYGYARKALVSVVLDHARRRSSTEVVADVDASIGAGYSVDSGYDLAEQVTARAALLAVLADLPPRQRACVVLRYFEDLSVADAARALGCSEGTVKSQTARALDRLRSVFEDSPLGELTVGGGTSW
ncbi:sigma-70 family RNA polymerase sigma factor [Pimelobacter simplex]|uniref:Putative RNA polymerase sigma factor n=1 Tax=Nocardioides simplex TaxID=2045 RepID=A0A0A1DHJ6_NOCSI|nr:SigE family RNA polymerase sigma factor [Pimelobacter simplex]AIY16082.1 putative RNA polymerase sigma factor [Pimelobacter simplex]MCG8151105.1 sigma-70 family RNA polymerase sigma factor [Pimelobacter simplex]GEB12263.1 RNA polymerase sigma24 factor [Pimelobacter simplex]SFM97511.1 RNA polymerase sigma-70 factor, sigma-E family [Pimelobacter simplex]